MKKIKNFILGFIFLFFILAILNYLLKNNKINPNIQDYKVIVTNSGGIKIE